ncbi:MAG: hypothetical protein ACPG4X_14770 [Pikeienuella sp.]
MTARAIHFVGFREDGEYLHACLTFGKPHFIHRVHDERMRREVWHGDLVVFGSKGDPDRVSRFNGNDIDE